MNKQAGGGRSPYLHTWGSTNYEYDAYKYYTGYTHTYTSICMGWLYMYVYVLYIVYMHLYDIPLRR